MPLHDGQAVAGLDMLDDETDRSCGVCRNYGDGFCWLYLEPVEYADTCQCWQ